MAQESYMRPQYPVQPSAPAAAQPGGEIEKKEELPKKEDKKKGDGKKEEKKEGKKEEKKEEGKEKSEEKIEKKDLPKYSAIDTIEKILKDAKETIKVKGADGKEEELDLADILENFEDSIKSEAADNDEGIKQLKAFVDQNQFAKLFDALKTVAPDAKNMLDPKSEICKLWKERIWQPYGARIIKWHNDLYSHLLGQWRLDPKYHYGVWNKEKEKKYKLDQNPPREDEIKAKKWKVPEDKKGTINLAAIRDVTHGIHLYFEAISKACGMQGAPPVKAGPKKKTKVKKKKVAVQPALPAKAAAAAPAKEEAEEEEAPAEKPAAGAPAEAAAQQEA